MAIKSVSAAVAVCLFMSQPVQANPFNAAFEAVSDFLNDVIGGQVSQSEGNPDNAPNVRQFTDMADALEQRSWDNRGNTTREIRQRHQQRIDEYRETGEYLGDLHDQAPTPSPKMSGPSKTASAALAKAKRQEANAEKDLAKKQKLAHRDNRLMVNNPHSSKMAENAKKSNKKAKQAKQKHKRKAKAVDRLK